MRNLTTFVVLGALFFLQTLSIPSVSEAQFESTLGFASFSGETFKCRTYPKGQDIVVSKGAKTKKVSKAKGKELVKKIKKNVNLKIRNLSKIIKEQKARQTKILNSGSILLPKVAKELSKLTESIAKLETKLAEVIGQGDELASILAGIARCGKLPKVGEGSVSVETVNAILKKSGKQVYGIFKVYKFLLIPDAPLMLCVSRDNAPALYVKVDNTVCSDWYEGSFSDVTKICVPKTANLGVINLFGKLGTFSTAGYAQDLALVTNAPVPSIKVYLPKNGQC